MQDELFLSLQAGNAWEHRGSKFLSPWWLLPTTVRGGEPRPAACSRACGRARVWAALSRTGKASGHECTEVRLGTVENRLCEFHAIWLLPAQGGRYLGSRGHFSWHDCSGARLVAGPRSKREPNSAFLCIGRLLFAQQVLMRRPCWNHLRGPCKILWRSCWLLKSYKRFLQYLVQVLVRRSCGDPVQNLPQRSLHEDLEDVLL